MEHKVQDLKGKVLAKLKTVLDQAGIENSPGYYYDHTSGKVLKGTLMAAYNKVLDVHIRESVMTGYIALNMNQIKPFKIEEELDEPSIEVLYGPIQEVSE